MRWIRSIYQTYIPFLLSLIVGILMGAENHLVFQVLLFSCSFILFLFHRKMGWLLFLCAIFCSAGIFLRVAEERSFTNHQSIVRPFTHQKHWMEGRVLTYPVPSDRKTTFVIYVDRLLMEEKWQDTDFRIQVSLQTLQAPEKGDRIQIRAKPYLIDPPQQTQMIRSIHAYATVYQLKDWKRIEGNHGWAVRVRNHVLAHAKEHLSPMAYQYFRVMAFGDQAMLDQRTLNRLKETGLLHLFVISGYHIAFVLSLGARFFRILLGWHSRFHRSKSFFLWIDLAAVFFVMGFLSLINIPISMSRAVGTMVLFLSLNFLKRKQKAIWNLGIVFFVVLLFRPLLLFDVSTQLTFASVAGILVFSEKTDEWLMKRNHDLKSTLSRALKIGALTLGASCFTMPILYFQFGSFYPASILYNLILAPTLGAIVSFLSIAAVLWSVLPIEMIHVLGFRLLQECYGLFSGILFWKVELYTLTPVFSSDISRWCILAGFLFGIVLSLYLIRKRKKYL